MSISRFLSLFLVPFFVSGAPLRAFAAETCPMLDPELAACVGTIDCGVTQSSAYIFESNDQIALAQHVFFDAQLRPHGQACYFKNFAGDAPVLITTPNLTGLDLDQADQDSSAAKLASAYSACRHPLKRTKIHAGAALKVITGPQDNSGSICPVTSYDTVAALTMPLGTKRAVLFKGLMNAGGSGGLIMAKCGVEWCAVGTAIAGDPLGNWFSLAVSP